MLFTNYCISWSHAENHDTLKNSSHQMSVLWIMVLFKIASITHVSKEFKKLFYCKQKTILVLIFCFSSLLLFSGILLKRHGKWPVSWKCFLVRRSPTPDKLIPFVFSIFLLNMRNAKHQRERILWQNVIYCKHNMYYIMSTIFSGTW